MISVVLKREKECLGSVRFSLSKEEIKEQTEQGNPPAVTNVYISRSVPDVAKAREVTVSLSFGAAQQRAVSADDEAILARLSS